MKNSYISGLITLLFFGIAAFSKDPIMVARAWVIWPIFLATALILTELEKR